ncbi:hypothetical protein GCM10009099_44480 [Caenispirillum bisanense]
MPFKRGEEDTCEPFRRGFASQGKQAAFDNQDKKDYTAESGIGRRHHHHEKREAVEW